MAAAGCPTDKYLPPRPRRIEAAQIEAKPQLAPVAPDSGGGFLG
jgi:hypothetical protein